MSLLNRHSELVAALGLPPAAMDWIQGRLPLPEFTYDNELCFDYGFPPALLPMLSHMQLPGYVGVVWSWCADTPLTYAEFYVEGKQILEAAQSFEQLRIWFLFSLYGEVPLGELAPLAEFLGICAGDQVREYFAGCSEVEQLIGLEAFKQDPPGVTVGKPSPGWLRPYSAEAVENAMRNNDLREAWGLINSPGADDDVVASTLTWLGQRHQDPRFARLVANWREAHMYDLRPRW